MMTYVTSQHSIQLIWELSVTLRCVTLYDACVVACSYYLAPKIEDDEEMEDNA